MYYLESRTQRIFDICQIVLINVLSVSLVIIMEASFIKSMNTMNAVDIASKTTVETEVTTIAEEPIIIEPVEITVDNVIEDVVDIEEAVIDTPPEESLIVETIEPEYYAVPLDEGLQDHIISECETYNIDPALIISIIRKESDYRDWIKGDNGKSFGLMQIRKICHVERIKKLQVTDLLDPYQNVTVGINYFAELMNRDKGVEWALMAYNGGPSYANKLEKQGIVSKYAKTVLAYSEELERV